MDGNVKISVNSENAKHDVEVTRKVQNDESKTNVIGCSNANYLCEQRNFRYWNIAYMNEVPGIEPTLSVEWTKKKSIFEKQETKNG